MVNITHPEFRETAAQPLPPGSLESLKELRQEATRGKDTHGFKLQPQQRFLRRVLSPDSPEQGLLMVHGTGVGKTCTAIQIAEEYIIRPEFQDKRVLILSSKNVEENFRSEIFSANNVRDYDGILISKQCTGRRYLDILSRVSREPLKFTPDATDKIDKMARNVIKDFYEFAQYMSFGTSILDVKTSLPAREFENWIHEKFDNRLIIIDEAHNIREVADNEKDKTKTSIAAISNIVKIAKGCTLVLLTATPMYDSYAEIIDYFNLFLWNEKKQPANVELKPSDFFNAALNFRTDNDTKSKFRNLCKSYISFIRGENPFTFPFRLPPPSNLVAINDREKDPNGKVIKEEDKLKYLKLTASILSPEQAAIVKKDKTVQGSTTQPLSNSSTLCTFPNGSYEEAFEKIEGKIYYRRNGLNFLTPENVQTYSAKFKTVMDCIDDSTGIAFVYSNAVVAGANVFAMCLEEHGYASYTGENFLGKREGEPTPAKKGSYILLTSGTSAQDVRNAIKAAKSSENKDGSKIKVIVGSFTVSEGIDFKNIRQIHILDPWYNMSRIEQIIGRGIRTLSHSSLPLEDQNCTVYLHICRYADEKIETRDEQIYRMFVERKAVQIAKVKKVIMESAMDCVLNYPINVLPTEWLNIEVPQRRSQGNENVTLKFQEMMAPTFITGDMVCKEDESVQDPNHIRPLSSILDVRDEVFNRLIELFAIKPIWKTEDIVSKLKPFDEVLIRYILQDAVSSGFKIRDSNKRVGTIQSRDGILAFAIGKNDTMVDRMIDTKLENTKLESLKAPVPKMIPRVEEEEEEEEEREDISKLAEEYYRTIKPDSKDAAYVDELRSNKELREWVYVDRVMTNNQRFKLFHSLNWEDEDGLPIYAKPLRIELTDGTFGFVFGAGAVYKPGEFDPRKTDPDMEKYETTWLNKLLKDFDSKRKSNTYIFFAATGSVDPNDTTNDYKFLLGSDKDADTGIQWSKSSKTIGGLACTSYPEPYLKKMSEWLKSQSITGKAQLCNNIELLVRKFAISGDDSVPGEDNHKIVWYSREQWNAMNEKDAKERLKAISDGKEYKKSKAKTKK